MTFDQDAEYLTRKAPTVLTIMPMRYVELRRTARGWACSGIPLVAFDGLHYHSAGRSPEQGDDTGLYLVVPALARFAGLDINTAINVLLIAVILGAGGLGLAGFLLTVSTVPGRVIGTAAFLMLMREELHIGDVYALGGASAIACVPWMIFFISRKKLTPILMVCMFVVGMVAQTSNFIRSHSGTGFLLLGIILVLGAYHLRPLDRILMIVGFAIGIAASATVFHRLEQRSDLFLRQQPQGISEAGLRHPLWHSVYIGLSYVKNPEVPAFKDEVANARASELHPGVHCCSPEYERVLRGEVLRLVRERPLLVAENLFLKALKLGLYCICVMNFGLLAAWLYPKPFFVETAFWVSIGFYALPGILVIPTRQYVAGFIVLAALYAAYSIEYALVNIRPGNYVGLRNTMLFRDRHQGTTSVAP